MKNDNKKLITKIKKKHLILIRQKYPKKFNDFEVISVTIFLSYSFIVFCVPRIRKFLRGRVKDPRVSVLLPLRD